MSNADDPSTSVESRPAKVESGLVRPGIDLERRKRVRRSALILALIAAAFYFGFIIMAVSHR